MKQATIESAIKLLQVQEKPYWALYQRGAKVADSPKTEGLTIDESVHRLSEISKLLSSGMYQIKMRSSATGQGGSGDVLSLSFSIGEGEQLQQPVGINPANISGFPSGYIPEGYISLDDHKEILAKEVAKAVEMALLKRDLEEVKEGNNSAISGFLQSDAMQKLVEIGGVLLANYAQNKLSSTSPQQQPQPQKNGQYTEL